VCSVLSPSPRPSPIPAPGGAECRFTASFRGQKCELIYMILFIIEYNAKTIDYKVNQLICNQCPMLVHEMLKGII